MRSDSDPRLLAVIDMDTVFFSEEGKPNTQLIESLKKNGIKDVCLLTELTAEEMLDPDNAAERNYEKIKDLLEKNNFVIHAVVTPIDPIYQEGKELGLAWKEELESSVINDKIIILDWNSNSVLMDLINNAIAGNITIELIKNLEERIKQVRDDMNEIIKQCPTAYLGEKAEYYEQINNVLSYIASLLLQKDGANKAIQYILSLDQIKNLPWLKVLEDEIDPDFSHKNSMYACMMPLINQFDGVVFVDINDKNLKDRKRIHKKLAENVPYYAINANFGAEENLDKKLSWSLKKKDLFNELDTLSSASEDDMDLLQKLKTTVSERLEELNKRSDNYTSIGVAFRICCIVLNVFVFQLRLIQKALIEKRAQFLKKLDECIVLAPEEEKAGIYSRYKNMPIVTTHRNLGLWGKTDASIAVESKVEKLTKQSPLAK